MIPTLYLASTDKQKPACGKLQSGPGSCSRQAQSWLLIAFACIALLLPGAATAQNAGGAFSCDGTFYQTRQAGTGAAAYSVVYRVDRSTSTYTTNPLTGGTFGTTGTLNIAGAKKVVNGLAYNSQDGYLYAVDYPADNGTPPATRPHLYKIGLAGMEDMGATTLPVSSSFAAGTFDKNGNFYLTARDANTGSMYKLSVNSATPLTASTIALRNATNTGNTTATIYDLAFSPLDNTLYGVLSDGILYNLELSGTNRALVTVVGTGGNETIGSAFFDISGRLYAYSNGTVGTPNSGKFFIINTATGAYTLLSNIDPVSSSDGASCINPLQRIDVTKELTNVVANSATSFDITYTVRVRNTGTVTDDFVQVSDLLKGSGATTANTTFPTASSVTVTSAPSVINLDGSNLTANASYTGINGNASLLAGTSGLTAGQRAIITYTVRVVFPAAPSGTFNNTAYATSTSVSPNRGYTQASNGSLLPPNDLEADDASTNSAAFADLRANLTDIGDSPSPTPLLFAPSISGTVFEDVNYGGGLGRTESNSFGVGRGGARVELYKGSGTTAVYNTFTTTAADGSYSFINLTAGTNYVVRVVNNSVTSSRAGAVAGLVPVQTYRTTVTTAAGTVPDLARVGGEDPARVDAANGVAASTIATLSSLTVAGVSIGTIPESQAPVALSGNSSPAVSVDFGYNFDLVVNTNDVATVSGNNAQGSLRQFIINSNALGGETDLAQVYTATGGTTTALTKKLETSIFMIPNGTAVAGQVAGLTNQFATAAPTTAATITLAAALPIVAGPTTVIDGSTQTRSTGDTNAPVATLGAESTGPEVILNLNNQTGLAFSGTNQQLLGLGITGSANASSGVLVNGTANGLIVNNNTLYSNGVNLTLINGATGASMDSNVIRSSTRANGGGIVAQSGSTGNVFTQNTFDANKGLAIDLTNGTTTSGDGVTINDNGDTDLGANGRINFPILTSATIVGSTVVVKGYVRANLTVELYLAAPDPTGFGEGQAYLSTFTQRATTGTAGGLTTGGLATYGPGLINNLSQGTDNVNTFTYTFTPTPAQLALLQANGAQLTSTATRLTALSDNFGTSEFSGNVGVNDAPTANDITNVAVLTSSAAAMLNPNLVATPNGPGVTIASYKVTSQTGLNGTLRYNGATVTTATVITDLTKLTYQPTAGYVGNATFQYNATDSNGFLSNTATYTIPVSAVADVVAGFPGSNPATATPAAVLALTVNFTNNGPSSAAGVVRSVQLPAGLGTVNVSNGGAYNSTTGLVSFTPTPTSLTPAGNLNATITISSVPAGLSEVTAVASISTTTTESGVTANNTATLTVPVTPSCDLATTISGPTTFVAGTLGTYFITTQNKGISSIGTPAEGTTPAVGAVQTVLLPAGLSGVFATNGGTYDAATGKVTFPDVALANGQLVSNSVSFSVAAPITDFAAQADVAKNSSLTGTDPVSSNNTAYLNGSATAVNTTTTAATSASANLYVAVSGPATVNFGDAPTYTVTQGNNGSEAAGGVQTQVLLPTGLIVGNLYLNNTAGTLSGTTMTFGSGPTLATYSQTTGVLTLPAVTGTQGSGATPLSYTIQFRMPATSPVATVTASVKATTSDLVPANNVATVQTVVQQPTDVTISLTNASTNANAANGAVGAPLNAGRLLAGQTASYQVLASNLTSVAARNVQQTVALPAAVDATTLRVNGQAGTLNSGVYTFLNGATFTVATGALALAPIANLMGGAVQSTAVSFVVPANNSASVIKLPLSAAISTSTPESNTGNNASSLLTDLTSAQDISVSLKGPAQAVVGNSVLYTVSVTNNGPSANGNVATNVNLPTALDPNTLRINNENYASVAAGVYTFTTGLTYTASTGVVSFPANGLSLAKQGLSVTNTIEFAAPDVTLLSAVATIVPSGTDLDLTNNTAQAVTLLSNPALGTPTLDLVTTATASNNNTITGAPETIGVTTTNASATVAAANVVQTLVLPASLVSSGGTVTTTNGGVYDDQTGVVTFLVGTLNAGASTTNSATFALPPNPAGNNSTAYTLINTASTSTTTPETNTANNTVTIAATVAPIYDLAATISGPSAAPAGATVTYAIALSSNGPSQASSVAGTVTLPPGVSSYTLNGTTILGSGTVTIRPAAGLLAGVTEQYQLSFTAPGSTFTTTASIANSGGNGETSVAPNTASVVTVVNLAPVAFDVVNTLQTPQSNSAAALPLAGLNAADTDGGSIASYTISSTPDALSQGKLYYNSAGTTYSLVAVGQVLTPAQAASLKFDPAASFVGSAFFTYTATDNGNGTPASALTSNPARYTIQVGKDNNSVYTRTPTKGGNANKYSNGDVLAYGIDPNGAVYNTAGLIYNANGTPATGAGPTNSGLTFGKISAADSTMLAGYGVRYTSGTGLFTVVDKTKLPRAGISLPVVNVTTLDLFGGVNTNEVNLILGVNPLPVELTDFTATAKNVDAALVWHTASEKNNDHFDVERSLNGTDFVHIAQVKGQGNSSAATAYALTDAGIGARATGRVYYRLTQVDVDGTATYSPVRTVSFAKAEALPVISLYPNPATSATALDLTGLPTGTYAVRVLDATGRVVLSTVLEAGLTHALDLNTIASGSYLLQVSSQAGGQLLNLTKRLIKE